ncbi:hypothetical protein WK04_17555 [Burkholderia ubonensis]|nr:hypothetical protein WK04_17555 [Burkholderia ubonensis]
MDRAAAFASIVVAAVANVTFACAVGACLAGLMSGSTAGVVFEVIVPVLAQTHFGAAWSTGLAALIVWTGLLAGIRESGRAAWSPQVDYRRCPCFSPTRPAKSSPGSPCDCPAQRLLPCRWLS